MAQWSDPRVTGTQSSLAGVGTLGGDVAIDAGLRAHMLKVYNYMASGVLLTGIVAIAGVLFSWNVNHRPRAFFAFFRLIYLS